MKNQTPLIGAHLLLIQDNKILMQKRNSGFFNGLYTLVAGHTEEGETITEAVIRESKEEANITLNKDDLTLKVVAHRPQSNYNNTPTDIIEFFMFADKYSGTIKNNEPTKCSELVFFPIDNLPQNTTPHLKKVIQAYINKQPYIVC